MLTTRMKKKMEKDKDKVNGKQHLEISDKIQHP